MLERGFSIPVKHLSVLTAAEPRLNISPRAGLTVICCRTVSSRHWPNHLYTVELTQRDRVIAVPSISPDGFTISSSVYATLPLKTSPLFWREQSCHCMQFFLLFSWNRGVFRNTGDYVYVKSWTVLLLLLLLFCKIDLKRTTLFYCANKNITAMFYFNYLSTGNYLLYTVGEKSRERERESSIRVDVFD